MTETLTKPLALSLWIADIVRERIRGELAPGARLVESDIATEFGISRSPIREALRLLERDGLVELIPHKGAVVTPIDVRDVEDIYAARMAVEGLAARYTAERMTEEGLAELQAAFERVAAAARRNDLDAYLAESSRFFAIEWRIAANRWLTRMIKVLGYQNQRYRRRFLSLPGQLQHVHAAYEEIMRAYADRDGDRAERSMRELLADSCRILVDHLRRCEAQPTAAGE
jgi:DNA-binding GntR family transcriptional regulator